MDGGTLRSKVVCNFFGAVAAYLQLNRLSGSYVEFGSHTLSTARMALNTLGQHNIPAPATHFFLFDTFSGMPTPTGLDRQRIWRAGMNATSLSSAKKLLKRDQYRLTLVQGLFEDTLPTFEHAALLPIAVAYVDCDYYESAKSVLDFLSPRLSHGSVLVFDDWDAYYADPARGERRAFDEFKRANLGRLSFEPFLRLATGGHSFIVHDEGLLGHPVE
jgi:O-methyltransferase